MKKKLKITRLCFTGCILLLILSACSKRKSEQQADPEQQKATERTEGVLPAGVIISNQLTVHPFIDTFRIPIKVQGVIAFDERLNITESAYFGGRIEKLYVRYNYQYIKKGQRIMDIYSPELNTAQENYLFLLRSKGEQNLQQKAEEQLRYYGLNPEQIKGIKTSGKALEVLPIYSTYEGYIMFEGEKSISGGKNKMNSTSLSNQLNMNMGGATNLKSTTNTTNTGSILQEGMYIGKGQKLFTLNNLEKVWLLLSIHAQESAFLKVDDKVIITNSASKPNQVEGIINFAEPTIREAQKYITARVYLDNKKGLFKVNELVDAVIMTASQTSLWIPQSAAIDLGQRKVVWLKTGNYGKGKGVFISREVQTGNKNDELIQIVSGLSEADEIVSIAAYMTDSETLIK